MIIEDLINALSTQDKAIFDAPWVRHEFKKNDLLQVEGKIVNNLFLIEKGYCRSYFIKDGYDITDFFFFENSFATDFASFYSNKPSILNLVCEEDVTLLEIKKEDLEKLYQQNIKFSEVGRITAEYAFMLVEERMHLLHTESLEIKYQWMLDRFPSIFQRVPQYHVASFLGVKPQSLSRIRAKIAGKIY